MQNIMAKISYSGKPLHQEEFIVIVFHNVSLDFSKKQSPWPWLVLSLFYHKLQLQFMALN